MEREYLAYISYRHTEVDKEVEPDTEVDTEEGMFPEVEVEEGRGAVPSSEEQY